MEDVALEEELGELSSRELELGKEQDSSFGEAVDRAQLRVMVMGAGCAEPHGEEVREPEYFQAQVLEKIEPDRGEQRQQEERALQSSQGREQKCEWEQECEWEQGPGALEHAQGPGALLGISALHEKVETRGS
ncbi:hypothetical protein CYMTET_51603 [Cymbomonas tetramitiformis]|uniref:Uncharacterized protein n=1 Tax=Cymbomonas tetramitiformis TaxID=36881 RepID=A0AAE0BLY2_9CHLO|nr:hypothetical protein CYMTET_51603 [Cymbomonas tetramitiformis]